VVPEVDARRLFRADIAQSGEEVDLARAALHVSMEEQPDLDVESSVSRLDALAAGVAPELAAFPSPIDALARMRELFARERFRGNEMDYFDPANSFLDRVLERRLGIPLTLSIVYLEIGWRCGLPVVGVGFPGHFLVKYVEAGGDHFVDPFEGARSITVAELRGRMTAMFGTDAALRPEHLAAASKREMLVRLNANLKSVYTDRGDLTRALAAVERILLLTPHAADEIRDRGLLYLGLHAYRLAAADLGRYLALRPDADDASAVRGQLEAASRERVRLN
jgi:regulator of sirC expression with transglutaminase-like and TPR domain